MQFNGLFIISFISGVIDREIYLYTPLLFVYIYITAEFYSLIVMLSFNVEFKLKKFFFNFLTEY